MMERSTSSLLLLLLVDLPLVLSGVLLLGSLLLDKDGSSDGSSISLLLLLLLDDLPLVLPGVLLLASLLLG